MKAKRIIVRHETNPRKNRSNAKGEWVLISLVAFGLVLLRSDSAITPDATWLSEWYSATSTAFATATAGRSGSNSDSNSYSYSYLYEIDRNNTDNWYSMNGNLWIPPPNIPSLSGSKIQRLFATENTLWIGDSTARQDMQTMYTTVSAKNPNNVPLSEVNRYISNGLSSVYNPEEAPHHCPRRTPKPKKECWYPCAGGVQFVEMAQVYGTGSGCEIGSTNTSDADNNNNNNNNNNTSDDSDSDSDDPFAIGKFDYTKFVCFDRVSDWIQQETTAATIRSNYTVLVLSLGIWEVVKENCNPQPVTTTNTTTNTTKEERQIRALDALRVVSGPDLLVLVKTIGPSQEEVADEGRGSEELNRAAREWFRTETPEHMDLVDFGGVVVAQDRTFGPKRFEGDIPAHWGFEARALANGMVAHAVWTKRKRNERKQQQRQQ